MSKRQRKRVAQYRWMQMIEKDYRRRCGTSTTKGLDWYISTYGMTLPVSAPEQKEVTFADIEKWTEGLRKNKDEFYKNKLEIFKEANNGIDISFHPRFGSIGFINGKLPPLDPFDSTKYFSI